MIEVSARRRVLATSRSRIHAHVHVICPPSCAPLTDKDAVRGVGDASGPEEIKQNGRRKCFPRNSLPCGLLSINSAEDRFVTVKAADCYTLERPSASRKAETCMFCKECPVMLIRRVERRDTRHGRPHDVHLAGECAHGVTRHTGLFHAARPNAVHATVSRLAPHG